MNKIRCPALCAAFFVAATLASAPPAGSNATRFRVRFLPAPCRTASFFLLSFDADKSRQFPILYFLHGLGDNEQFFIHSGAWNLYRRHARKGRAQGFSDRHAGWQAQAFTSIPRTAKTRYEDFLLQEFFPFIEKRYRVAPGRSHRAIAGISMGGYGALHLAFRHPQLFVSISAHSAALIEKLPAFLGLHAQFATVASAWRGVRQSARSGVSGSATVRSHSRAPPSRRPENLFRLRRSGRLRFRSTGPAALDKILTFAACPARISHLPGRHDAAYFAEHLPASLIFASHAFSDPR